MIVPKRYCSAFTQTDLDATCRVHGIPRLVVTGQHTDCCCRHTSYDAFARGITVTVVSDATAVYEPFAPQHIGPRLRRRVMRSDRLARRIISAAALGPALVAALAACGSSSTSSVSPPPSTHPPASATALIKANWEAFFSGTTAAAKKITLLQNGQAYAAIINAQSG